MWHKSHFVASCGHLINCGRHRSALWFVEHFLAVFYANTRTATLCCEKVYQENGVHQLAYLIFIFIHHADGLRLELSSSRAFGHIGRQLGAILNGQLQHIQPLEIDHLQILLESSAARLLGRPVLCLPSAGVQDIATFAARWSGKRSIWPAVRTESAFWYNVWQFPGVGPEQDFLVCNVVVVCDF